ncbi:MAG: hypothetical protein M1815_006157 [Lichina confinis]|nr:MAG: hypothetical protein M1815_006157 [Lichina confinis]
MADLLRTRVKQLSRAEDGDARSPQTAAVPAPGGQGSPGTADGSAAPKALPKGVVLGKDGKPCRSCTSFAAWAAMTKKDGSSSSTPSSSSSSSLSPSSSLFNPLPSDDAATQASAPADCPPDVDTLGRHTWTFLHSMSASYPEQASAAQQRDMSHFLQLFSQFYPCSVCADDLRDWMREPGNEPRGAVAGRDQFGRWMCRAHNEVNRKLGKPLFDCARWQERWREGWRDGRCD